MCWEGITRLSGQDMSVGNAGGGWALEDFVSVAEGLPPGRNLWGVVMGG